MKNSLAAGRFPAGFPSAVRPPRSTANTSRTMPVISPQYITNMDTSVPRCSSTSKNRCPSSAVVMPKRSCSIARCPELEMGRNSATPCTRPRMIAFNIVTEPSS